MKSLSRVITQHGFIFATSVAMFVHSTWTFNTLFAGEQPHLDGSLYQWVKYALWVTPGALIALAIDIGQVQTSARIVRARRTRQRVSLGVTFFVLAVAGYYLQWFHLIHHMPELEFGTGLTEATRDSLRMFRDAAIFVIPALLPLATILYTLSEAGEEVHPEPQPQPEPQPLAIVAPEPEQFPALPEQPLVALDWPPTGEEDTEPLENFTQAGVSTLLQNANGNAHSARVREVEL